MRDLVIVAVLALAACGCSTTEPLIEQHSPPSGSTYAVPTLAPFKSSAVTVDLTDCPSYAMMTKRGISGVSRPIRPFPLRSIVESECVKFVKGNFRLANPGETPVADVKVSAERVILRRDGVMTTCDLELILSFVWRNKGSGTDVVRHYESRQFGAFADEDFVPTCVYQAVQDVFTRFLRDLAGANARAAAPDNTKW